MQVAGANDATAACSPFSGVTVLALRHWLDDKFSQEQWKAWLPARQVLAFTDPQLCCEDELPDAVVLTVLSAVLESSEMPADELMLEFGRFLLTWAMEHAGYQQSICQVSGTFIGFARCLNRLLVQLYACLGCRNPHLPEAFITDVAAASFTLGVIVPDSASAAAKAYLGVYQGVLDKAAELVFGTTARFAAIDVEQLPTGRLHKSCRVDIAVSTPQASIGSNGNWDLDDSVRLALATRGNITGLDPETFNKLFPFHFAMDLNFRVLQAGEALMKLVPEICTHGMHVQNVFTIRQPAVLWNMECLRGVLENDLSVKVVLASADGRELCGGLHRVRQMQRVDGVLTDGADTLLFIGSPYLTSLEDMEEHNLYLSDFPAHEQMPEHLMMAAAKQSAVAEALREAQRSNYDLRETLAETLASQQDMSRHKLNIDSAGQTLLNLLDNLLMGVHVDAHQVVCARNVLLRAGNNVWKPLDVDWSQAAFGDSEVNESLAKMLGAPGMADIASGPLVRIGAPVQCRSPAALAKATSSQFGGSMQRTRALMLTSGSGHRSPNPLLSSRGSHDVMRSRHSVDRCSAVVPDGVELQQLQQCIELPSVSALPAQPSLPCPPSPESPAASSAGDDVTCNSLFKAICRVFKPSQRGRAKAACCKQADEEQHHHSPSDKVAALLPHAKDGDETILSVPSLVVPAPDASKPFVVLPDGHGGSVQLSNRSRRPSGEEMSVVWMAPRPPRAPGARRRSCERRQHAHCHQAAAAAHGRVLGLVDEWQFDAFALESATGGRPLSCLAFHLFTRMDLISRFSLDSTKLARFLTSVEDGYGDHQYHSRTHAADVLRTLHVVLNKGGVLSTISKRSSSQASVQSLSGPEDGALDDSALQLLTCYLAAIVHDYEHRGVNNDFLIRSSDTLALTYNDSSPQENHHVAAAFTLMHQDRCAFMPKLSKKALGRVRKGVIDLVLATDMKQHFALTSSFQHKVSTLWRPVVAPGSSNNGVLISPRARGHVSGANTVLVQESAVTNSMAGGGAGAAAVVWDHETEMLVLKMSLKVADLGHLTSSTEVHKTWVAKLEQELFRQGDRERALGQPISPLMDRTKAGIQKSQCGFFTVVALPMYQAFAQAFPLCKELATSLESNFAYWKGVETEADVA